MMNTITKSKKNYISYLLITVWLVVTFFVKSIIFISILGGGLIFLSFFISYSYLKQIESNEERKRYILKKLTLTLILIIVMAISIKFLL